MMLRAGVFFRHFTSGETTLERISLIRGLPVQTDNDQSYQIVIVHIATIYDHIPEVPKLDHFSKYGAFIGNELSQTNPSFANRY